MRATSICELDLEMGNCVNKLVGKSLLFVTGVINVTLPPLCSCFCIYIRNIVCELISV